PLHRNAQLIAEWFRIEAGIGIVGGKVVGITPVNAAGNKDLLQVRVTRTPLDCFCAGRLRIVAA
ncbi:MAG: hypothetical protein LAN63_17200, partial [Acidobacteriia bacterium]|nr:hypothetical protein [Terriglobia bacterium]